MPDIFNIDDTTWVEHLWIVDGPQGAWIALLFHRQGDWQATYRWLPDDGYVVTGYDPDPERLRAQMEDVARRYGGPGLSIAVQGGRDKFLDVWRAHALCQVPSREVH